MRRKRLTNINRGKACENDPDWAHPSYLLAYLLQRAVKLHFQIICPHHLFVSNEAHRSCWS